MSRPPVAYHVELDVDAFGALQGDEDKVVSSDEHDWFTPHPQLGFTPRFKWRKGTRRRRPNFHWYHSLYNWVCDASGLDLLNETAPNDIHVIARAEVDGEPAWVIQVVTRLDGLVDRDASLIDTHPTYELMRWPSFRYSAADRMANRVFGIPEMYLDVFCGTRFKAAIESAGLTGLRFTKVDWTNDLDWSGAPERDTWQQAMDLATASDAWPRGMPEELTDLAILLGIDIAMRQQGLLATIARISVDHINAAPAAAGRMGLPELEGALRELPLWTKNTIDEIEGRYLAASRDDAIRRAYDRQSRARDSGGG